MERKKSQTICVVLDEDIGGKFYHIKRALGLRTTSETIRFLINHYSIHMQDAIAKQEAAPDA